MSKLISKISISIWKCDLTLRTKINYIYFERHPVLKFAASWTGSLLTQRLITNCSEKPSLKSSPTLSPNKASWLLWRRDKDVTNLLKPTTADCSTERWDGPRGSQRSPGRHWEKTWDQSSSFGNSRGKNSWESNGNSKGKRQTHPGATSPRNRRKNSQRFQADRAQTEPTQEQKTPPCFDSQELMKMMMKEFFQRKEEDRKWEKKEKPDSA